MSHRDQRRGQKQNVRDSEPDLPANAEEQNRRELTQPRRSRPSHNEPIQNRDGEDAVRTQAMDHVQTDNSRKRWEPLTVTSRKIDAHERREIRGDQSAEENLSVNGGSD